MVNRHAALFHHLLEVPVAQRVGRIPADADQDHIDRKAHPFEVEHINSSRVRALKFTRLASRLSLMRQNLRSTAAGFCFNFGRVGAIAGIKLVPVLIPLIGFAATISMASVAYLLAAVMVFTLQETKGIQLTSGN